MNFKMRSYFLAAAFLMMQLAAFSQDVQKAQVPDGWHLMDQTKDGFFGISLDKAYAELLKSKKGRKSKTITVAVIDSGVDTLHEDLKPVLWRNAKEIAGNGKDDDRNGYIDDVYGWNFLGGKDGKNVNKDSEEAQRLYFKLKKQSTIAPEDTATWHKLKNAIETKALDAKAKLPSFENSLKGISMADSLLRLEMNKETITGAELEKYQSPNPKTEQLRQFLLSMLQRNNMTQSTVSAFKAGFEGYVNSLEASAALMDSPPEDYRGEIVKDNYMNFSDKFYGNADVMADFAFHGTHCSGIIGAKRDNGLGIDGVADNVKIMMVRAVPNGDEHDKDIALAIRYAVDNGARVISMSFGKGYSPEKQWVDEAVRYAEKKGVLLVHAAGNDHKNIDVEDNFPNQVYLSDGKVATNMITVGASGDPGNGGLTASFSNYGKTKVDVFAPGVKIYSTIPGVNTYGNASGTSMAAPVVAGLAALILEHYPKLKPAQVKDIIVKSCVIPVANVKKPGTNEEVPLSDLCVSGGIVNAYEALKLAAHYK